MSIYVALMALQAAAPLANAQTPAAPPTSPPPPATTAKSAPSASPPGVPAKPTPPAAPSAPAPATRPLGPLIGPAPSRRAIVLAAVRAEWPRYDAGAKGRLTPLEFSTWVLRSHGLKVATASGGGPGVPAVKAMNATASAFAMADANHDGGVTQEEMAAFLTR